MTCRTLRCWWRKTLFDRQSLTWTVAAVAVETGIAPSELLADVWMLRAIISYMKDRNKERQRGNR
jgi:hypothetical protein